jgi:zinc protease
MAWRTAARFAPGDAELDVLALVLSSFLTIESAKSPGHVQRFDAAQLSFELGSVFIVSAVLGPRGTVDEVTALVDRALEIIAKAMIPVEIVQRADVALRSRYLFSIDAIDGLSSHMAEYARATGTVDFFARDLARYDRIEPEVLRSVAQGSLRFQGRVVLLAEPSSNDVLDILE